MVCGSRSTYTYGLRRYFIERRDGRGHEHAIVTVASRNRVAGPLRSGSRSLQLKKPLLPLQAPAIACKLSITSNDSMTWDGDCDGIAGTGPSHSASCRRLSDHSSDLLIGPGLSARNLLQRLPNLALKRRRLHVQREMIHGCTPVEELAQETDVLQ